MSVVHMEIPYRAGAYRPGLFRLRLRDALADYCARTWPVGRRKAVRAAFGLSEDEARAVINGSASAATLDKAFDAGGWSLVLEVFALRFGEHVSQHLAREAARHAERSEAVAAMARAFRSGGSADPDAGLDDRAERAGRVAALDRRAAERGVRRSP